MQARRQGSPPPPAVSTCTDRAQRPGSDRWTRVRLFWGSLQRREAGPSLGPQGLCRRRGGAGRIRVPWMSLGPVRGTHGHLEGLGQVPFAFRHCVWVFSRWDSVLGASQPVPVP